MNRLTRNIVLTLVSSSLALGCGQDPDRDELAGDAPPYNSGSGSGGSYGGGYTGSHSFYDHGYTHHTTYVRSGPSFFSGWSGSSFRGSTRGSTRGGFGASAFGGGHT